MNTLKSRLRAELTERLDRLCTRFRFRWGQATALGDEEVEVSTVRVPGASGRADLVVGVVCSERLMPVLTGYRWSVLNVHSGEAVCSGEAPQHSDFRLSGLPSGEYRLEIRLLPLTEPSSAVPQPEAVAEDEIERKFTVDEIIRQIFTVPEGQARHNLVFSRMPLAHLTLPSEAQVFSSEPLALPFEKTCELIDLGVSVHVREFQVGDHAGELWVYVRSIDPGHLGKAVSVGLVGSDDTQVRRQTVLLEVPEEGGVSGAASFGALADVVRVLGRDVKLVVFLLA